VVALRRSLPARPVACVLHLHQLLWGLANLILSLSLSHHLTPAAAQEFDILVDDEPEQGSAAPALARPSSAVTPAVAPAASTTAALPVRPPSGTAAAGAATVARTPSTHLQYVRPGLEPQAGAVGDGNAAGALLDSQPGPAAATAMPGLPGPPQQLSHQVALPLPGLGGGLPALPGLGTAPGALGGEWRALRDVHVHVHVCTHMAACLLSHTNHACRHAAAPAPFCFLSHP
jgi:hypothetical protein